MTRAMTVKEYKATATKGRKTTPEGEVLRCVKEYLTLKGWQWFRVHQSMGSTRGLPDLFAFKGRSDSGGHDCMVVVAIEVKAAPHQMKSGKMSREGKLSPHQEAFKARWEKEGGLFITARGIDDLREAGL